MQMMQSKYILNSRMRIECAPTFGRGYLAPDEDCLYSGLAHLVSPLIWPWMMHSSPAVNAHGKEAFNMTLTWLVIMVPLAALTLLAPTAVAVIFAALFTMTTMAAAWLGLHGMAQARRGRLLRYPFNLRLIK